MVLILTGVYLLFSTGVVKATHICMGRKASVAYFTAETPKCACARFAGEKDTCCDDEHELIKLQDSQNAIPVFILSAPALIELRDLFQTEVITKNGLDVFSEFSTVSHSPPRSLFKLHCSFVFYDREFHS
jgi:hypothetical protein